MSLYITAYCSSCWPISNMSISSMTGRCLLNWLSYYSQPLRFLWLSHFVWVLNIYHSLTVKSAVNLKTKFTFCIRAATLFFSCNISHFFNVWLWTTFINYLFKNQRNVWEILSFIKILPNSWQTLCEPQKCNEHIPWEWFWCLSGKTFSWWLQRESLGHLVSLGQSL